MASFYTSYTTKCIDKKFKKKIIYIFEIIIIIFKNLVLVCFLSVFLLVFKTFFCPTYCYV